MLIFATLRQSPGSFSATIYYFIIAFRRLRCLFFVAHAIAYAAFHTLLAAAFFRLLPLVATA